MSFLSILLFFILILIVFIIVSLSFRGKPSLAPPPVDGCLNNDGRMRLPLIFDPSIGVYRSTIRLGDSKGYVDFSTIPDTGSSVLIVSGPECKSCNPRDGIWDYRLGQNVSNGQQGVIRYGGGQKTIYIPWQAQLMNYDHNYRLGQNGETFGIGKNVNFGVIKETFSPDGLPVNVLGLQEKAGSFLDGVCGEKTVIFDFPRERLYLGQWDEILFDPKKKRSTFDLSQPKGNGPQYPIATIKSIEIDGEVVKTSIPRNAIFDTGTTNTIVSAEMARMLGGRREVTFNFEKKVDDGSPSTVTFKIPPGSVEVGQISYPSSIIIGNRWLSQYGVGFRHDQDQFVMIS